MELPSLPKSRSKFFQLTNSSDLNDYTNLLAKCANNQHKYSVPENPIQVDSFGDPYVVFQYFDDESVEDSKKNKVTFFGQILQLRSPSDLATFDELTDDHHAAKIKIVYAYDYTTKDKIAPVIYRLVIYTQAIKGESIDNKTLPVITNAK